MLAAMPDSAPSPLSAGGPALRDGGDACPGTLRLHRADDGALARVRVPGGVLSADRAEALLAAAGRFGDGELHLTSRGNVQLRGLGAECGGGLAELLAGAGLLPSAAHERARNIVASPLAGLDGSPALGERLAELDALVCASAAAASLSGRFLFALDDGRGDVDALGADVTLIADGDAFLLRIGPGDEVFRIPAAEGPRAALRAAEAFLRAARDSGAWRVKDLPDPVRSELVRAVGATAGPAEHQPRPRTAKAPEPGTHGPGGTVETTPGSGAAPETTPGPGYAPETTPGSTDALPDAHRHVNPHGPAHTAAPDHSPPDPPASAAALAVDVPLGRLTPGQWRLLTATARRYGGELRLTPWRGIVVPGPFTGAEAADALGALAAAGLITSPDSPWTGVGACIGRPGCAKSLADVRAEAGAALGPAGRLPVYWSGCERRCGHPHGEWIDVVATPDGHRISYVRGERRDPPATVRDDPAALAAAVAAARARAL
ncbi:MULTISPECIES: cobalamin biosynthesis protein CobG [Streptomyces]|uniref:cobalamin biosynthesis protein CobG n=1 Tax=Streptomyces TaxID=1883 RepID=UPI0004BD9601|nr:MULTISPECIES: cobalamin biosynthesis protein CobG [Streptomyces]KOG78871.1 cobalamin biosynthesis protein CobG [Streptomyces griseus subsp. rhodochrous]KOU47196.1 cobalamin biosynthesis protein CobG [Streptomyces sp. MMG1522]